MIIGDDKLVCRERTILWRLNAAEILDEWKRMCALDVIGLWDAPPVVRQYLESGDDSLRAVARDAARDAAAAVAKKMYAAWAAAAASDSAWATAAASAAAEARSEAGAVAERTAAWEAAWAAARASASVRYNRWLVDMVEMVHQQQAG